MKCTFMYKLLTQKSLTEMHNKILNFTDAYGMNINVVTSCIKYRNPNSWKEILMTHEPLIITRGF